MSKFLKGVLGINDSDGEKMIESSRILSAYRCRIYCNDRTVASALRQYLSENDSVEIFDSYVNPARMYSGAKAVICRAGRNTTSELLYLKIPSILLSANNDFRSEEQKRILIKSCNIIPMESKQLTYPHQHKI